MCFLVMAVAWVAFARMYPSASLARASVALPATAGSSSLRSSE
jgi:hypothetical protein